MCCLVSLPYATTAHCSGQHGHQHAGSKGAHDGVRVKSSGMCNGLHFLLHGEVRLLLSPPPPNAASLQVAWKCVLFSLLVQPSQLQHVLSLWKAAVYGALASFVRPHVHVTGCCVLCNPCWSMR